MNVNLDLHIHSSYSKGTSPFITLNDLAKGAQEKGINVLGTGDCLCDGWLETIRKELKYDKRTKLLGDDNIRHLDSNRNNRVTYFIPTVEINCIWGKKQAHILLIFPASLSLIKKVKSQLLNFGNFNAGRPSLALSPKELQEIVKEVSNETILIIPAHIFTPHYGLLGSKNNFVSITEEFNASLPPDAIETGLSASVEMAWRVKELRSIPLVSFSDAHSIRNIGREYTVIDNNDELSYSNIVKTIRSKDISTREYIPQLGKYYLDGHKKCKYSYNPEKRLCKYNGDERWVDFEVCRWHKGAKDKVCVKCESKVEIKCQVCGKRMTKGVLHRVLELSKGNVEGGVKDVFIDPTGDVVEDVSKLDIKCGFDGQFGRIK